jgi:hypothetical protein
MPARPAQTASGGCLCGAVRYEVRGTLRGVVNCHCSVCRRWHGHHGAYTSTALDAVRLVEDRGLMWYDSASDETSDVSRGFCGECGSSLFWHPRGAPAIAIAAGSLDAPTGLPTIGHVWTSRQGDYYELCDRLPRHERGAATLTG